MTIEEAQKVIEHIDAMEERLLSRIDMFEEEIMDAINEID